LPIHWRYEALRGFGIDSAGRSRLAKLFRLELGNPADFIVGPDGRVLYAHYGVQYADSLTAAAVVEAFESARASAA
jgi:hypothetical protein